MNKNPVEKEWEVLLKNELQYRKKHSKVKESFLQSKLEKVVPKGLQDTLDKAFKKGFEVVFSKGIGIIEKTYRKESYEKEYEINEYAAELKKDRKSIRQFGKKARQNTKGNLLITGVEGIALGAFGVGLPDIPVFIAVLLKSVNQIALSYGFDYDTNDEKQYILQLISTAVVYGEDFNSMDTKLNQKILSMSKKEEQTLELDNWMDICAKTLSRELLYMKFLQGIPVAGIIGGLSNITCLQTVSDYALLKYQRRFLLKQQEKNI